MKRQGRRRYLQTVGATVAAGLSTATAGCSSIDGFLGNEERDVRPLVARPGWFEQLDTDHFDDEDDDFLVSYVDRAALREHADSLPDWLVESQALLELDATVDRHVTTLLPENVLLVEFADEAEVATAAEESDSYEPVSGVDGYHGQVGDGYLGVTGEGWAMGVGFPEEVPDRPADELLPEYARLLANRPSSFDPERAELTRLDRMYDAVEQGTLGTFHTTYDAGYRLAARAQTFAVGSDQTRAWVAGMGEDVDAEWFEEYETESPRRDYGDYDDIEASNEDGVAVLTGTTPTAKFDKLNPEWGRSDSSVSDRSILRKNFADSRAFMSYERPVASSVPRGWRRGVRRGRRGVSDQERHSR